MLPAPSSSKFSSFLKFLSGISCIHLRSLLSRDDPEQPDRPLPLDSKQGWVKRREKAVFPLCVSLWRTVQSALASHACLPTCNTQHTYPCLQQVLTCFWCLSPWPHSPRQLSARKGTHPQGAYEHRWAGSRRAAFGAYPALMPWALCPSPWQLLVLPVFRSDSWHLACSCRHTAPRPGTAAAAAFG